MTLTIWENRLLADVTADLARLTTDAPNWWIGADQLRSSEWRERIADAQDRIVWFD